MIHKYKTEGKNPKDFRNYQNPIDPFKDLLDGNLNPRKVLKTQNNFKSNLGEIRKRNPNLKSKDQVSAIQNVQTFFDLGEKTIDFF